MKTIFVNRFFYPDHSATSQILSELAFRLAEKGHTIEIITSRLRYDDPGAQLPAFENIRNVKVHRVASTRFGRAWLPGRLFDYLSFYLSASWRLLRLTQSGDIVVAKTDPPMISLPASWVARTKAASLVNWLQDIFPEVAQALGIKGIPSFAYAVLLKLRNSTTRNARQNVVLGEVMAQHLRDQGVADNRITVIHNMAVGPAIEAIPREQASLRDSWGLKDKFVVCYSGNLGRAHDYDTMLDAARLLQKQANIVFLFIGGGANFSKLKQATDNEKLANIRFEPYQDIELLSQSLAVADAHLVSLRPELEGLIVPSKIYGIMAAGRATLFIGSSSGEIAGLLERCNAGETIAQGDAQALANKIRALAEDPGRCKTLGDNARSAYQDNYMTDSIMLRWEKVLFPAQTDN